MPYRSPRYRAKPTSLPNPLPTPATAPAPMRGALGLNETAAFLDVSRQTIWRMVKAGKLRAFRVNGHLWRISVVELNRYISECEAEAS